MADFELRSLNQNIINHLLLSNFYCSRMSFIQSISYYFDLNLILIPIILGGISFYIKILILYR